MLLRGVPLLGPRENLRMSSIPGLYLLEQAPASVKESVKEDPTRTAATTMVWGLGSMAQRASRTSEQAYWLWERLPLLYGQHLKLINTNAHSAQRASTLVGTGA